MRYFTAQGMHIQDGFFQQRSIWKGYFLQLSKTPFQSDQQDDPIGWNHLMALKGS